ncbi:MAG: transcription termination/antitermination NusG family protein [Kiritimatiellia bacterium]
MNRRVVLRQDQNGAGSGRVPCRQPFTCPEDLFGKTETGLGTFWTCVRTRPRWEKKFAEWLMERRQSCFLPVFRHETFSGRKRRTSELPLFPGFVFARGDLAKKDFAQSGSVAYVLKPRSKREAEQLHRELKDIWQGLTSGLYVTPVQNLAAGEPCRIVRGPLRGVEAKFERMGREGRLILQVEMMGGGVAVEVPSAGIEVCS